GAGLRRPAVGKADLVTQAIEQGLPDAVELPASDLAVDGLPGWEVVRQHAPGHAATQKVEVGVEDLADGDLTRPAARLGRDQGLGQLPLLVGQVTGVALSFHGPDFTQHPLPRYSPLCKQALREEGVVVEPAARRRSLRPASLRRF